MIFNSFTVANDLITILARDNRTAVAFSCRQIKTFEGICLALRSCEFSLYQKPFCRKVLNLV